MKLQHHVVFGGVSALLLIPLIGVNSLFFWLASVLIDADHYLDYLYRNGFSDFSMKRMFVYHEYLFPRGKAPDFLGLSIFHTAEFILLVAVIAYFSGWLWLKAVLWGILFHMVLDLTYLLKQGRLLRRALSLIEYAVRWRQMKKLGMHPEYPYRDAFRLSSGSSRISSDHVGETAYKD